MFAPMRILAGLFVISCLAVMSPEALAAPPGNDLRTRPTEINSLPARVTGTTVDAGVEADDPGSRCSGASKNSVFYEYRADRDARVVVRLDAGGDLDGVVDVYRRTRSQLFGLQCYATDSQGNAQLAYRATKGEIYLIRVAAVSNSVAGPFILSLGEAQPEARPPGTPLPAGGRRDTVDRVLNPSDAWSVRLRAGVTYRVNLSAPVDEDRVRCIRVSLFEPGTRDFDDSPRRSLRCGGYFLFTPGPDDGGRYSILVQAVRGRNALPYNIEVAPAGPDDTAPGVFIRNDQTLAGALSGSRIDAIDLYRFDVTKRSTLNLRLATQGRFDLVLLNDNGRRLECSCFGDGEQEISRRISPGRYFAAVRAQSSANGSYRLTRISRALTSTRILINGASGAQVSPGTTVRLGVRVSPGISGPVTILVERFDPLSGYQFYSRYQTRSGGGTASVGFTPPSVGRWRARAVFKGTRIAATSESGYARLLVAGPLRDS